MVLNASGMTLAARVATNGRVTEFSLTLNNVLLCIWYLAQLIYQQGPNAKHCRPKYAKSESYVKPYFLSWPPPQPKCELRGVYAR